jgi:homoserine O-succinyltransferase
VPVRLTKAASTPPQLAGEDIEQVHWACAFVNNMPDGAFDATERQFLDLLETSSGAKVIEVRRYAVEGVPRGERVAARIAEMYSPTSDIYIDPPDLLIVTGSNPLEHEIRDEPYWAELSELISWSSDNVSCVVLSCLSAHAALAIFDGLERVHLASKCAGVFTQHVDVAHPLSVGLDKEILLPHSRWSTVATDEVRSAGYHIALESDDVGWSVATKDIGHSTVVLIQGHPEYDPSSLLREYRRDAGRYVRRELDVLPTLPLHCVAPDDWEQLTRLHESIVQGHRNPELVDSFPFEEVGERATWAWRSTAQTLYTNILSSVR